MSTNWNDVTPAAPTDHTNVVFQTDGSGNVSAYVPQSAHAFNALDLSAQAANISATDLVASADVVGGIYRVTVYIIVSQAATTSSTLPSVTISWTGGDSVTAQSVTVTAASPSGNVLTTLYQGSIVLNSAAAAAIQYATSSYASSGGTPMQYALHLRVERVN